MLAGLERVLETTADAAFMVEQLSLAAVGRELPSYVSWLSGPAADGDDGPEEFVVIVVDNGRSRIRESDESEILNCIRCGSCLTVCPVYSKVGGHAYGSVYGGPIGAVLTPLLTGMRPDAGPQAAVPLLALRRLHGRVPGRHPAARHAYPRPRPGQSLRPGLGAASARPGAAGRAPGPVAAPVPRLGAGGRALRPVRARLRARRELARRARHAAASEHQALPPALERPGERRVIDAFIAALEADGGQGARVADVAAARVHVGQLLGEDATLCFWSGDPLVTSLDPAALGLVVDPAEARAGITGADFGVAATGTLVLTYGAGRWRTTGLLPDLHIAVLPAERIVATLDEAVARVYAQACPSRDDARDRRERDVGHREDPRRRRARPAQGRGHRDRLTAQLGPGPI